MFNRTFGLAVVFLAATAPAWAGAVFVTGHDPVWHSGFGGNFLGAKRLAETGIDFARNGSALPFLFIESKTTPVPGGNAHEAPFLDGPLKYGPGEFVVMDAAELAALPDFATALAAFSAIVVASDHGGMLTGAELGFLNNHSTDIINYINAGGGVYAAAESNTTGLIGATPRFGFLPFLVSSADFGAAEVGNTVTPFGASLGLVNSDVNGNFSHNFFSSTGGMTPVDYFNGDPTKPLSLAFSGQIGTGGVIPEPGTALFGVALGAVLFVRRRERSDA